MSGTPYSRTTSPNTPRKRQHLAERRGRRQELSPFSLSLEDVEDFSNIEILDSYPKTPTPPSPPVSSLNAPRKKGRRRIPLWRLQNLPRLKLEEERVPEWKVLADTGYIRIKFLQWTPEDAVEADVDTLNMLTDYYNPASQAQNFFEEAYFSLMRDAVKARLDAL